MKIAIDISQIVYGTGVSSYTKNLVANLLEIDHKNEYVLFAGSLRRQNEIKEIIKGFTGNYKLKVNKISPSVANILWNKIHTLPIETLIGKIDVLHTSDWSEPPSSSYKVTTVHDLSPIIFPKYTNPKIISVFEKKLHWVKKESKKIIVPTETTKEDLIKMGFDQNKIEVIYEGLDSIYKTKQKGSGNYLLAVGTAPRKNLKNSILAFKNLKKKGTVERMVVIGHKPDVIDNDVTYVEGATDSQLKEYYANSKALIYASLYEGFGLPILEAFSQDCPVVTSNLGSMKEVAGDAAVLVDPNNVSSIEEGIVKALKNEKSLIKKGQSRLKDFSWKNAAQKTLKVYEQR